MASRGVLTGSGATGAGSAAEVARHVVAAGVGRLGLPPPGGWQDPHQLADLLLSHGAAALGERLRQAAEKVSAPAGGAGAEAGLDVSAVCALATEAEARKDEADPPPLVKEVRRLVRAELGAPISEAMADEIVNAAEAAAARREPADRPAATDLVGVLRAAEAELTSREARAHGGGVGKDSLAARVQSATDHLDKLRPGHQFHFLEPALATQVRARLQERGAAGRLQAIPQGPAQPSGTPHPALHAMPPAITKPLGRGHEYRPTSTLPTAKNPVSQGYEVEGAREV